MSDDRQPPTAPEVGAAPASAGRDDGVSGAAASGGAPSGAVPGSAAASGAVPGGAVADGPAPGGAVPGDAVPRDPWAPPQRSAYDGTPEVVLDSGAIPEVQQDRDTAFGISQVGETVPLVPSDGEASPSPRTPHDADAARQGTPPQVPLDKHPAAAPSPEPTPWAPPANDVMGGPGDTIASSGPVTPAGPSVHDQQTITSLPAADSPPAAQAPQGWAAPTAPSTGAPQQAWAAPTVPPSSGGPHDAFPPSAPTAGNPFAAPTAGVLHPQDGAVPPPPIAPDGPGQVPYGYPGGHGYPGGPGYGGPPTHGAQGYYGWPGAQAMPSNGLGTAGLVVGIVAAAGFCLWPVAIILGILGVIFGAVGRSRANRGEATNPGQALAGIICGTVGILLGAGFGILVLMTP
ncbi:DUF4190 domain-containing protein [Streptomyces sp. NPDC059866]|uniref:DUF4190 domain-containing protein n=1 Tax=Streptomyces sp. NPDC059866 TaxID=3346978 RepID=UPI003648A54F